MLFIGGYSDEIAERYKRSDKLATEIILNIRTVLSLNYQRHILQKYTGLLENNPCESLKRGAKVGVFFGLSIFFLIMGIGSEMFAYDNVIAKLG